MAKLPLFDVEVSPTPRRPAPMPPFEPATCEALGICSNPVARLVTPHVMNPWVSGLYELAGQSICSNGVTTYCVVSYGSYAQPILNGLPSGAVAWASGTYALVCVMFPSAHGRPSLPILLNSTFSVCGTGCVGHVFTSGDLFCGTGTSLTGMSGLPVSRSRMNVMPYL